MPDLRVSQCVNSWAGAGAGLGAGSAGRSAAGATTAKRRAMRTEVRRIGFMGDLRTDDRSQSEVFLDSVAGLECGRQALGEGDSAF